MNGKKESRILILSLRNIKFHVSRCSLYEFEDAISNFDLVDMLTPSLSPDLFKITNYLATHTVKLLDLHQFINPLMQNIRVNKKYDLLFVFCQYPSDILAINAINNWRKICKKAVCLIDEIWLEEIEQWKNHLRILNNFDVVFLGQFSCFNQYAEFIKAPCYFMPNSVDALKFFPYPVQPERSVDVYNIGRRSPVTHQGLLDMAEKQNFFYVYDTLKSLYALNAHEHRQMYINLLKRSRYFIANKPKIEKAYNTGGKDDLSLRLFEGAAAGTVILGVPPEGEAFTTTFNWEDAVIPMPYDVPNIAEFIAELDAQ
ncbi:MAG: glycosyltransferase family 1 protein, partial [Nostocaceae cyanobacterium]|nr:glycosyltransferase family 1 protein [Nostocaceae cyanobacterium]